MEVNNFLILLSFLILSACSNQSTKDVQIGPETIPVKPACQSNKDCPLDAPSLYTQTLTSEFWGLDAIDGTSDGHYRYRYTGSGIRIYIIDTGVMASHPEIDGRVLSGFEASSEPFKDTPAYPGWRPESGEGCSHGLHVASLAAGKTVGLAKNASIIPLRIVPCKITERGSNVGALADALNWVIGEERQHSTGRAVVNMSFGMDRIDSDGNDLIIYSAIHNTFDGFVGTHDQEIKNLLEELARLNVVMITV